MSGDGAPMPMRREDLALWQHLAAGARAVTVVAGAVAPTWLTTLPRCRSVAAVLDEPAARAMAGGTVVLYDDSREVPPATLAALHESGTEVLCRRGSGWHVLRAGARHPVRPLRDWLLRTLPGVANLLGVARLRPPFRHDGGACWWASLGMLRLPAPDRGRRAVLCEDGRALPLADCAHDEIRRLGGGRYSVWERGIYFASSDNSDPATNGRTYEVRIVRTVGDDCLETPATDEKSFADHFARAAARRSPEAPAGRRVLLLISSLGPGGAERQFCNLAKGLAARGHEVGIASLDGFHGAAGHYLPLLDGTPVQLLDLSAPDHGFRPAELEQRVPGALDLLRRLPDLFAIDVWRTATHVAGFRPDVLHAALDKTNLLGAVAGVATGVPRIVLSMRNVNPTHFPYLDVPWFRRWYSLAATVPGLVLSANSLAGGADYAQWLGLPAERVATVHNGLDPAAMPVPPDADVAALRAGLGIAPGDPVLVGVFRLSPEKRPMLWLEVVAALRERFPRLRALHVGHGPEHDAVLARVRELGLQDTVRMLGRRSDPLHVLRCADLLLLVSTFEGIPNVALEAQWLERPVVCTAAGGSVEAVQHGVTGFVVEPPEAAPLAAACTALLADAAARERMGRAGRTLVATRFSVDAMVDGSIALYGPSAGR